VRQNVSHVFFFLKLYYKKTDNLKLTWLWELLGSPSDSRRCVHNSIFEKIRQMRKKSSLKLKNQSYSLNVTPPKTWLPSCFCRFQKFSSFNTRGSNLKNRTDRIFYCTCHRVWKYFKMHLNYILEAQMVSVCPMDFLFCSTDSQDFITFQKTYLGNRNSFKSFLITFELKIHLQKSRNVTKSYSVIPSCPEIIPPFWSTIFFSKSMSGP